MDASEQSDLEQRVFCYVRDSKRIFIETVMDLGQLSYSEAKSMLQECEFLMRTDEGSYIMKRDACPTDKVCVTKSTVILINTDPVSTFYGIEKMLRTVLGYTNLDMEKSEGGDRFEGGFEVKEANIPSKDEAVDLNICLNLTTRMESDEFRSMTVAVIGSCRDGALLEERIDQILNRLEEMYGEFDG